MRPWQKQSVRRWTHDAASRAGASADDDLDQAFIRRAGGASVRPAPNARRTASRAERYADRVTDLQRSQSGYRPDWGSIADQFDDVTREIGRYSRSANDVAMPAVKTRLDELADQLHQRSVLRGGDPAAPRPHDTEPRQIRVRAVAQRRDPGADESADRDEAASPASEHDAHPRERLRADAIATDDVAIAPPDHPVDPAVSDDSRAMRTHRMPWTQVVMAIVLTLGVVAAGAHLMRSHLSTLSTAMMSIPTFHKAPAPQREAAARATSAALPQRALAPPPQAALPLPTVYGVYAVSRGQLIELDALAEQVPDARVAISRPISRPSRVTLADGRVEFIVFRRDMTSIAERIPVRVIARVHGGTTSDPDAEPADPAADVWAIRNISFDFRVAPVERNRDMVLLRAKDAAFTLPAGRYALVLKGQAYDFSIAGPVTDRAQCLERIEAENGSFYHECRQSEAKVESAPPTGASPDLRSASKPRRAGANGHRASAPRHDMTTESARLRKKPAI